MRDLAFMAAWIVLVPVALQGAQLGVLLWTWTSLLEPNDILYSIGSAVPFSKIAALLTLGLLLAGRGGDVRRRWDATMLLLAALALLGLAAQADCLAADPAPGWVIWQDFAKVLLLAMVVRAVMRDRVRLHAMLLVICLGVGFASVGEAGKFLLSGGGHKVLGTASIGDNNRVALDALLIMPLAAYLHATAERQALRLVCLGTAGMCGICVIATASRAGFIGLALLGLVFVLASRRKLLGLLLLAALALAGTQLVSNDWVQRMNTIQSAEDDTSFMARVGAWKVSAVIALERPLLGGGFHAVEHPEVWNPRVAAAGNLPVLTSAPLTLARAAHSIYFEVLGDLGVLGLVLFLALLALAWRNARAVRRLVRRSGRDDLRWAAQMAGALAVSLLLFLVVGASLSVAYHDIDYLPVAMLAALRDVVERALREAVPAPVRPPAWGVAARPALV
jgi:probable O-glycosylation ligase (exosortase A-associated)